MPVRLCLKHNDAGRSVRPLPRKRGRDREGACNKIKSTCIKIHMCKPTPSPALPRKRGREQTEFAGRADRIPQNPPHRRSTPHQSQMLSAITLIAVR